MILVGIFGGVALMVVLVEKFAKPMEPEKLNKIARWVLPLAALAIVLQALNHYF